VVPVAERVIQAHSDETRFLPLAAQGYLTLGRFEDALDAFKRYFIGLPEAEAKWYHDLSLVAKSDAQAAYDAADDRDAFLAAFWTQRDRTLTSGGVARWAEHYRRVWYARTYFGVRVDPWDRRGDVYVRYGEPSYRSRSDRMQGMPSEAVQAVKERNALTQHWSQMQMEPFGPLAEAGEKWQMGRDEQDMDDVLPELQAEQYREPTYPIQGREFADVPWESWVYTHVGDGVEFVFTDLVMNGQFDFPPMPSDPKLLSLHPELVLKTLVAHTPEMYTAPPGVDFLDFYYDLAAFRGADGHTRLEVYIGLPHDQFETDEDLHERRFVAERTVVLNDSTRAVKREARRTITYGTVPDPAKRRGRFAIDAVSLEVPPGAYRLAVQLMDQTSGKWGVYVQELDIPAFPDSLTLSDLELAHTVLDEPHSEKFQKGDVWVIPMPTRYYKPRQSVFVYYEVYNLSRD